jgi:hypothetical protein
MSSRGLALLPPHPPEPRYITPSVREALVWINMNVYTKLISVIYRINLHMGAIYDAQHSHTN